MNYLESLPTEIIEMIYFLKHKSYQKEINNFFNNHDVKSFMNRPQKTKTELVTILLFFMNA